MATAETHSKDLGSHDADEISIEVAPSGGNEFKAKFLVEGMTCSSCVGTVERGVQNNHSHNLQRVAVNLLEDSMEVTFEEKDDDAAKKYGEAVVRYVESLGFDCKLVGVRQTKSGKMGFKAKFLVEGMTCSSCVGTVERGVQNNHSHNLQRVAVNLLEDSMEVTFEEKDDAAAKKYGEAIVSTVECLGFDCKLLGVRQTKEAKERKLQSCNIQFELNPPLNGNSEVDSLASKLSTIVRSSANKDYPDCVKTIELVEDDFSGKSNTRRQGKIDKMSLTVEFSDLSVGIRTLCVTYIDPILSQFNIVEYKVSAAGGTLSALQSRKRDQVNKWKRALFFSLIFTIPCFLISMILPALHPAIKMALMSNVTPNVNLYWGSLLMWLFATPVQFVSGKQFYLEAYAGILRRNYGMSFLISLGTSAAYFYSAFAVVYNMIFTKPGVHTASHSGAHFFETSAMLISFVLLGKFLEALAKKETSSALAALMKLKANSARLVNLNSNVDSTKVSLLTMTLSARKISI